MSAPSNSNPVHVRVCAVCLQPSRYVCPRCGINYCSLKCYRDIAHRKCSEEFYRECCVNSLQNDLTKGSDRVRMLDILRREAAAERMSLSTAPALTTDDNSADNSDESSASDSFSTRFENLRLESDNVDSETVWSCLTRKEQRDFFRLLNSGELSNYVPVWNPWWYETSGAKIEVVNGTSDRKSPQFPLTQSLRDILPSGKQPHLSVIFTLMDVLLGYAFICRLYNGDVMDLTLDALHVMCQIVASFGITKHNKLTSTVVEKKEPRTVPRYTSTSQVAASIQIRLCNLQLPCGPQLMIVLLEDLAALVSSNENTFRVLNEIRKLIAAGQTELNLQHSNVSRVTKRQLSKIDQKLVFLLACFNPKDPVAVQWQSSIQPPMDALVSSVLCMHLTNFKAHDQLSVRPAAGPNWRKMIRENTGVQTQEPPLITECRTNE
ncbi:uncharacterized protein DEA37_0004868 [Paragonimus westermani]|uniref:HIT-type domain-containing protein n=1 Tax=Paragonimus westermani TaxID=34504 RepID=A0A5J4NHI7_9TREM|nr:uncharacterized protein DEA37_0004868 [Paragonimus westermani]